MNKGRIKTSVIVSTLVCMGTSAIAGGDVVPVEPVVTPIKSSDVKRTLQGNMVVVYNVLPGNVDTIRDLFAEGIFYARLRSNTFYWDWAEENYETGGNRKDNKNMGVGASLVYKSAVLNGFSGTIGYYGSLNPDFFRMPKDEVGYSKSGKDTFSRYKVKNGGTYDGSYGMGVLGQAYLEYNNGTVDVIAGRQLFESVFTASNDTKMVPNTFDGVSVSANIAPKTRVRAAWFAHQKLRDHEDAHDVITFKNAEGDSWGNNDDAAVHRGLSYNNFVAVGDNPNHEMFLADIKTNVMNNLDFTLSALTVPGVLTDVVAEAYYRVTLENEWAVRPGLRYFYQIDDGGGDVAAVTNSNLSGKTNSLIGAGYTAGTANSLDSSLFAGRVDLEMPNKQGFFRLGYSKVADKADIVAPWRAFPTGGFTRAMAQYNWFANTETFMAQALYKFNPTWKASLKYAVQDYDDTKTFVPADSDVWNLDTWTNFTDRLSMRLRFGFVDADPGSTGKADYSYNEYRLEFNYLF